jgi:amidase
MAIAEYEDLDGLGMAALVRNGDVTALELIEEAIARIEARNPILNAVIYKMYDQARELASSGVPDGPFAGVPFMLKDNIVHCKGTPTTHGCKFLIDVPPSDFDTILVQRFKRAGLITVGKTNTPEMALSGVTEPTFWGPTRNPWDTSRTPGGSSGGSGAAVAARIVPMAHAGDGGGSIRIPSSCCGLVGFKPSRMRTPQGPDHDAIWEACATEFALTRSVRDSATLLDQVGGQAVGAFYSTPPQVRPYAEEIASDPAPLRIAYSARGPADFDVHPDCRAAVEHAAKLCADLGHHVEEATPPLSADLIEAMGAAFMGMIAVEIAADVVEMARLVGREPTANDFEATTWTLIERGRAFSGPEAVGFKRVFHQVARAVGPFFEDYDVYLAPTLGKPPLSVGELNPMDPDFDDYFARLFDFIPFTPLFNITGQPGVSLPLHWNDQGLPIGVQFLSKMGAEGVLYQLAGQLERAQPWADRRPPDLG